MQSQENDEKEWAINCENARNSLKDEWEDQKKVKVVIIDD